MHWKTKCFHAVNLQLKERELKGEKLPGLAALIRVT